MTGASVGPVAMTAAVAGPGRPMAGSAGAAVASAAGAAGRCSTGIDHAVAGSAAATGPDATASPTVSRAARRAATGVTRAASRLAARPRAPGNQVRAVTANTRPTQASTTHPRNAARNPISSSKVAVPD